MGGEYAGRIAAFRSLFLLTTTVAEHLAPETRVHVGWRSAQLLLATAPSILGCFLFNLESSL